MSHRCRECGTTDPNAVFRECREYDRSKPGCGAEECLTCSYAGKPCPYCGREKGFLWAPNEI